MKRMKNLEGRYRPYIDRFHNHPYAIPVTTFLVLFFLSIASFIGLNARTDPPSDSHVVVLSIDGTKQSIPSRSETVNDFLARAEIRLEPFDRVEPERDTRIDEDKFHVNIYRARPVTIVDDSGKRTFAYSAAVTPRSVVSQAGIKVYPEDKVETVVPDNFLREGVLGEKVTIERSTPANINLYGSHVAVRTHTTTVGDLLKEKSISLDKKDSVRPKLSTPITQNIQIFVFRSGQQIKSVTEEIPMPVEIVEDRSLSFGSQAIRQVGSPGKRVVTYQIDLRNGKEIRRRKIQEVIAEPPVKQIVARGPQGNFGQALAKLRQCEAGGNYAVNTGNGFYGAYQFVPSTWSGVAPSPYNNESSIRNPGSVPASIQDIAATNLYKRSGWSPWPACSAGLGLQDIYR
ncbi:MAG TPA: ubiquitin-like domain-containing protein [Candidatus Limnocylindria bacterium]|nr:ubiquitin-like domain-containing protein [Candidatus Limnocylindria bacterium]